MSRELSRNQQRLAAIAAFGVFWGGLLVTIGFPLMPGRSSSSGSWVSRRSLFSDARQPLRFAGAHALRAPGSCDMAEQRTPRRSTPLAPPRCAWEDRLGRAEARRTSTRWSSAQFTRRVARAVARSTAAGSVRAVAVARSANAAAEAQSADAAWQARRLLSEAWRAARSATAERARPRGANKGRPRRRSAGRAARSRSSGSSATATAKR